MLSVLCAGALSATAAIGQVAPPPNTTPPSSDKPPARDPGAPGGPEIAVMSITARLKSEAERLRALVSTPLARAFLAAAAGLPEPGERVVWRSADKSRAYSQQEYEKLSPVTRKELVRRVCTAEFYYYTGYGSPLIYSRPLEVLAERLGRDWQPRRVLDFGYGSIGHLRVLASLGVDVHGIEVEPMFRALYSQPGDTGTISGAVTTPGTMPRPDGRLTLHEGRWPGDDALRQDVGRGYDLIISKNVLKRSYIHPEREVDEKHLVKLGADDEQFVRALRESLSPSGIVMIYNIAPAQNPPDKPYLAHADGRCPFPREMLEKAGFEVLAFDEDDAPAIHRVWQALELLGKDERPEDLPKTLFAHYTLLRKVGK